MDFPCLRRGEGNHHGDFRLSVGTASHTHLTASRGPKHTLMLLWKVFWMGRAIPQPVRTVPQPQQGQLVMGQER